MFKNHNNVSKICFGFTRLLINGVNLYLIYHVTPASVYLFKISNENIGTMHEICSKLSTKTRRRRWGVVSLLLTLDIFYNTLLPVAILLVLYLVVVLRCSVKKGVLRNLTKFTGKHLCQCLFFNKVACNF